MREYRLLSRALARFERALVSGEPRVAVTRVSSRLAPGRGLGREHGLEYHSRLWGDLDWVLELEEAWTPLPLAWRFRFGWLVGVADLVRFVKARPVAVYEVKSYDTVKRAERVQAALYGLLVELNFATKPSVRLKTPSGEVEVKDWEALALDALRAT
ncbi:hypothetical protein [Thermofilum pendens]|uniref:PD-(D/E)XK endonuclease-like domain-containing protein n=1 Tax=Thermofilum pendens (strain DSM 2475 / Hrk 5) TaxID=368408 RepID=A1RYZ2_THEPD|nr:hypothetical protein [Thermofilum pendens]ABL78422.1 hypothetical protein Tpen_1022 [Thermofilum pendens Hrk 5]